MAEGSDKILMADHQPLIAYRPIKCIIKLEIPDDENQQVNTAAEEEDWTLKLPNDSDMMEHRPILAYPPIQWNVKQEMPDELQDVNDDEVDFWNLQIPKDTVTPTGNASTITDLQVADASLSSDDSGQSKGLHPKVMAAGDQGETREMDSEEEGSEYDEGCDRSEHSSLEDFDQSDSSFADDSTDDKGLIQSPKTGPSKEPTCQVLKAKNHRKKKDDSNRPFKCSKCERSYKNKPSLTFHLKYECGIAPGFSCNQCAGQFKRRSYLRQHLTNVHNIDQKQLHQHVAGVKERREPSFKCTKCSSCYKRKRALNQHTKYECGITFQCTMCKKELTSKYSLRNHLLGVHDIARSKLDKFGVGFKDRSTHPYKCERCGRTYLLKDSLVCHLKSACGAEPSFNCPQCEMRCTRKSSLKLHLIEIHQVDPSQLEAFGLGRVVCPGKFKCDQCGTTFTRNHDLKRHLAKTCGK